MGIIFGKKKLEKKMETEKSKLYAPIEGRYIPLSEIPDESFAKGYLGKGCGIEPIGEKVVSPVNGTITTIADTKHAIGIMAEDGEEILIHVGMDTVMMNGKGFQICVREGDYVERGQLLMEFNIDTIIEADHPITTAFVITNSDEYREIGIDVGKIYRASEEIGGIIRS